MTSLLPPLMRRCWPFRDAAPTLDERHRAREAIDGATDADVVAMLERVEATKGDYLNTLGIVGMGRLFAKALLILLRRP